MVKKVIIKAVEHPLMLFCIIGLALIIPVGSFAKNVLPVPLAFLMYINFLSVKVEPGYIKHKSLFFYALLTLIVYPVFLYLLPLPIAFEIKRGIIIAVITPTAIASPVVCDLIHGNRSRIVTQMVIINIVSPFIYTLVFFLLFQKSKITIPYIMIAFRIALLILLPLLLSRMTLFIKNDFHIPHEKHVKRIVFYFVVFIAVSSAAAKLKGMSLPTLSITASTVFLLALTLFFTGSLLAKNATEKKTDALLFGHKNIGLSVWISLTNFTPETSIPLVLYVVSHHIINGILIARNRKEQS